MDAVYTVQTTFRTLAVKKHRCWKNLIAARSYPKSYEGHTMGKDILFPYLPSKLESGLFNEDKR